MKQVYLYKIFERFWHWSQALLIFSLILTGFEVHGSYSLLGFDEAVKWHNISAYIFIVLIIFSIFWHLTTDEWRNYVPTIKNFKAQMEFYLYGIFKNAPHPTKKQLLSKLNPIQRIVYLGLKILVIPVMVLSGLVYMYYYDPIIAGLELQSLELVALFHTAGAFFLIVFVIVHLYLITTGTTVGSNLKAMITGWEDMEEEEADEVIDDAIENVKKNIKQ